MQIQGTGTRFRRDGEEESPVKVLRALPRQAKHASWAGLLRRDHSADSSRAAAMTMRRISGAVSVNLLRPA